MSSRAWVASIALGLALSFGALAQEDAAQAPVEQEPAQQQPAERPAVEPEPVVEVSPPAIPAGSEHDDGAAKDSSSDTDQRGDLILGDGIAQWVMALTGLGALLLSALAVWLLKGTLEATRLAAKHTEVMLAEAEKTTAAAEQTLAETKRLGEIQTSAYLYVDDTDCGEMTFGEDSVSVCINFKNYGQSPAREVFAEIRGRIESKWKGGATTGYKKFKVETPRGVYKKIVQTGVKSNFYFIWRNELFSEENIARMKTGEYQFIVSYWIEWETVFGATEHHIDSEISTVRGFVSNPPYKKNRNRYPLYPRDPQIGTRRKPPQTTTQT